MQRIARDNPLCAYGLGYNYTFDDCFSVVPLRISGCSSIKSSDPSLIVTATIVAELSDPDRRRKSKLSFPMFISTCLDIGRGRVSKWWDWGMLTRPNGFFLRDSKGNAQQDEGENDALCKDCYKTKQDRKSEVAYYGLHKCIYDNVLRPTLAHVRHGKSNK